MWSAIKHTLAGRLAGKLLAWGLLACCFLDGCGYRVLSGERPFGAQRVAVVPFEELQPVGIAPAMAAHLSRLLASSGMEMTQDLAGADAVLTGSVDLLNMPGATLTGVQIYTANLRIHAELRERGGAQLWDGHFEVKEDFLPTDPTQDIQPLVSETNRRTALRRLAETAAQRVQASLVVDSALARGDG